MKKTKKRQWTRTELYQIMTGAFIGCLLISNVLASKVFTIGGITFTSGVIIFPIVFIINDIMSEVYGFHKARNVIILGFIINLFAVLAYTAAIQLPAPDYARETAIAFETILGSTWRILLASFTAYITGSLLNAHVMVKLKEKLPRDLMLRCMVSTILGEGVDAVLFAVIVFIGRMSITDMFIMIVGQTVLKTLIELVCYPVTKVVIRRVKVLQK